MVPETLGETKKGECMTGELAVKEAAGVPMVAPVPVDQAIKASDLVVPRLRLIQSTSPEVADGKAKLGDIWNSQTHEVVGNFETPLEIIPLKMFKSWRVMDVSGKQAKWVRDETVTSENESREWEGREDIVDKESGQEKKDCAVRYDFTYNFFILIKKEVDAGDGFPAVISMRRTSAMAGKHLSTHLFKRQALKQHPASKSVIIKVGKQRKEQNTWGIFEIHQGSMSNEDALAAADRWLPLLDQMRAKIDEPEAVEVEGVAAAPVVVGSSPSGDASGPY